MSQLLAAQRTEITEYHIYRNLTRVVKDANNRGVLERIAADELRHYDYLKALTRQDVQPDRVRVAWYTLVSRALGLSFGLRLMEQGEQEAGTIYEQMGASVPDSAALHAEEQKHEEEVLGMIEEERIEYAGSMVLGLNDALVELTGALAGLTFALQNGRIIAVTGVITGIAASMSMAASGYLSAREEADARSTKNPLKAAVYTGIAYIITVLLLVCPYLVLTNVYLSLAIMLATSVLVVLGYNFYITTAKGLNLWRRFSEMTAISLSVALISFLVGIVIRKGFGFEL